jgi:hypothetical protein
MKNEIKFEYGFESVNGIIKKVYSLSSIPNIKEKCDVWNVLPIVYVRQFTGLKDKNSKDIYEKDILKTRFGNKIYFINLVDYHLWNIENSNAFNEAEIIGNIYQNPELLK